MKILDAVLRYNLLLFMALVFSGAACASETQQHEMAVSPEMALANVGKALSANAPVRELQVVRVIDSDFEDISDNDLKQILATAKKMYQDKFGFSNVRFKDAGKVDIKKFFSLFLKPDGKIFQQKNKRRFLPGVKNDFLAHKKSILKFVKQWKLEELQSYFPENERSQYSSYEKIYDGLAKQMQEKIDFIGGIKQNGESILAKSKIEYRSFLNWLTVLENQDKYDLVLTNTFILYDDISQPSPHGVFSKCKVGGVSHKNLKRDVLGGRVIMGSTFGMDTKIPFFAEKGKAKVNRQQRNEVTGAFVVAHELGHALFKLPDHYNHGPECLMNNNKAISYKEGYDLLIAHPGPCAKCQKWITARKAFWEAESYFEKQQWEQAIEKYVFVIKNTPKNVDGSRNRYMAHVSYMLSRAYDQIGDRKLALRGAELAHKLFRWEEKYKSWKVQLEAKEKGE